MRKNEFGRVVVLFQARFEQRNGFICQGGTTPFTLALEEKRKRVGAGQDEC